MIPKEVFILFSALTVAGCSDPARYSTPALDPDDLALATHDRAPGPAPKQPAER